MTSFNLILGGTSCTLCRTEVSPSRAGGFHAPKTETHSLKIRLPASHSNPAAFILPGGGPLRLAIEATRTLKLLASRIFVLGPRTIFDFCRPLVAAGKPSFLCSLLKHRQEPRSGIFNGFQISPGGVPFDAHFTRSAGSSGLVRVSDTHRDTKRKRSWVTNIGSETT